MKDYIYCSTTSKGEQSFYLMAQGKKYFLFVQELRKSNKQVFEHGVSLFELKRLRKHHSTSVSRTAAKIPAYVRYIEQEYGICVMESSKRKRLLFEREKPRQYIFEENEVA